jgi:hypothetical protein
LRKFLKNTQEQECRKKVHIETYILFMNDNRDARHKITQSSWWSFVSTVFIDKEKVLKQLGYPISWQVGIKSKKMLIII